MIHILKLRRLTRYFLASHFLLLAAACDNIGMNEQQMLQNAKVYIANGRLTAASIELRNTLQKNNKNAEAHYMLGSINLKVGDIVNAEKEFRQAEAAGWSKQDTQLQLARILIKRKAFEELLDEIKPLETWTIETRANITGLRALAEASLNNLTEAKSILAEARSLDKDAIEVYRSTAILQLARVLEGSASDTLDTARLLHPSNPEILLMHAANDIQNNNPSRAADSYRKVIELDPDNFLTTSSRKARLGLARLLIIEKNYDEADSILAPLLLDKNIDPKAYYLAGLLAFTRNDLSRAEGHARKLLSVTPDNMQAQLLMGKIKYAQKDFDQAALHLSSYLNASPHDYAVRILLTNAYIYLNQPRLARKTLQVTLNNNPDDATALTLLSEIEFGKGDMSAGIAALKKASGSSPANTQLHKRLAQAHIRTKQTRLAHDEIATYQALSNDTKGALELTIRAYQQEGQTDKALKVASKILASDPDNPMTLALIGALYFESGDNRQARIHFSRAIKLQEDHPAATIGLARIERKEGNVDKAMTLYKNMIDANKAGTLPMLELSMIAAQQQHISDMISWLEMARNTAPEETLARTILAKYYLQDAQPKKAEIYTKEALKKFPEKPELLSLHGKVLIAQGRYKEAIALLRNLAINSPESTTVQNLLGEAFLRQHMLTDARRHFRNSLMLQKHNIVAISLLAETELKDGNYDLSLEYANTLQKRRPNHYLGYRLEGDAWMAKKIYERAHHAYDNAWDLQHTAPLAKRLFLASNNFLNLEAAIQPILSWLKDNPDDHSTRAYLAAIYQSAEKNEKAIKEYEKVLTITPDNSFVLNNLAWLYLLEGNPKALDTAERAYRFSPENPGILDTYGWILIQSGRLEKGQRLIEQALNLIPGNLDIRYHFAVALIKSGNSIRGKEILTELLSQDKPFSGREEAERSLKKL